MGKSDSKSEKSFWETVPGIITAIATLLTAVVGCIVAMLGVPAIVDRFFPSTPTVSSPPTTEVIVSTPIVVTPTEKIIIAATTSPTNIPPTSQPTNTTIVNYPPNAPRNQSPPQNAYTFKVGIAPTLCVAIDNYDPDGDSITYKFVLTDGSSVYYDSGWINSNCTTTSGSFINTAGAYYWHAKVQDSFGNESPWGDTWNISMRANRLPNKPTDVSPPTGYIGVPQELCINSASDPDGDRLEYAYVINNDAANIHWTSEWSENNCTILPQNAFNQVGTYYWLGRVRDIGNTDWISSETRYFVVK